MRILAIKLYNFALGRVDWSIFAFGVVNFAIRKFNFAIRIS